MGNYHGKLFKKIAEADTELRKGDVNIMRVLHDDWCALLAGRGDCNRNPEICEPENVFRKG